MILIIYYSFIKAIGITKLSTEEMYKFINKNIKSKIIYIVIFKEKI